MSDGKLLQLGHLAAETRGASFVMSCKKNKMWVINFSNMGKKIEDMDIEKCLNMAIDWIKSHRIPISQTFVKYTLYEEERED